MNIYATADDLVSGNWLDRAPANATSLLRSATVLVALAAGRNPYTDPAPAGPEAAGLRDATCAQVAAWVGSGIDPTDGVGDTTSFLKRTEIFEGKIEYDTALLAAARAEAIGKLTPEAAAILQVAGLAAVPLPLFDDTGALPTWGLDNPAAYRWPAMSEWPRL